MTRSLLLEASGSSLRGVDGSRRFGWLYRKCLPERTQGKKKPSVVGGKWGERKSYLMVAAHQKGKTRGTPREDEIRRRRSGLKKGGRWVKMEDVFKGGESEE
jgi:hypothetical protein